MKEENDKLKEKIELMKKEFMEMSLMIEAIMSDKS